MHFVQITGDITKTASDIGTADYYSAGMDIADIMVQTVGPVPASKIVKSVQPEDLEITQWWTDWPLEVYYFKYKDI